MEMMVKESISKRMPNNQLHLKSGKAVASP
jgi:hypothetical protein